VQEEFEGQSAGTSPNWRAWASIRWWPSSVEKAILNWLLLSIGVD